MDAGIDLLTHAVVSAETGLWGRETGAYTGVGASGRRGVAAHERLRSGAGGVGAERSSGKMRL